jgi:hypothetical protein
MMVGFCRKAQLQLFIAVLGVLLLSFHFCLHAGNCLWPYKCASVDLQAEQRAI